MADNNYENQAAAASLPAPVPDVPAAVEDEVGKQLQVKELRRPLLAMQIMAPVAVMPADSKKTPTPPVVPDHCTLMVVLLWATLNAYFFIAKGIATVILNFFTKPSSTKLPWHFRYVTLTNEAADKMWFLLCGELLYVQRRLDRGADGALRMHAAADDEDDHHHVPPPGRRRRPRHGLGGAGSHGGDALHEGRLRPHPPRRAVHGNSTVHVAFIRYICLAVDLLAGIILSCSPRRRLELAGEHLQDGDEDEKV